MSQPNVLLVVLDSVRARNTSLHEYPVATTPYLSTLSNNATKYTQARSPSIHSIASHASIFSGYHVEEHNVTEHESKLDIDSSIWTTLSNQGYSTGLFTPNVVITRSSNLDNHFDNVVGPMRWRNISDKGLKTTDIDGPVSKKQFVKRALKHDYPIESLLNGVRYTFEKGGSQDPENEAAEIYIDEFFNWQSDQQSSWAACINLMDAHYPYVADSQYRIHNDNQLRSLLNYFEGAMSREILEDGGWWALSALENLYDECIRQADDGVRLLVEKLKEHGLYDDTLIVVTSDHGEAFAEYSQVSPQTRLVDHSWGIHEVQTHVPLVVKYPGQTDEEVINQPASLTKFPSVVEQLLSEGNNRPTFVPDDKRVISSTYRIPEPGDILPPHVNKQDYIGPWRAVYEEQDGHVVKYSTHGTDGAIIDIFDAQNSCVKSRSYPKLVDDVFDGLSDACVNTGANETDGEIENQLEALGYLR